MINNSLLRILLSLLR